MRLLAQKQAASFGYSADPRKQRRQHRQAANDLLRNGGAFNGFSARGSTFHSVATWHLEQAKLLTY